MSPGRPARAARWAVDHPVLVTAALGVVVAVVNVWWVRAHRELGAFNVDEAGYMAASLRLHRSLDLGHPWEFVTMFLTPSSTGPMVPLITVPFSEVLGQGAPVLLAAQAAIGVLAAVGAAGATRVLAGGRSALLAGVVTLATPAMVQSARGFQYAACAGAFLCLAVWALIASDRGQDRRRMALFGLATGAMVLSRTMALGFLPALGVGALIVVRRDRRGLTNLAIAAAASAAVGLPWVISSRDALYDYLVGFGYGDQSRFYGSAGFFERIGTRFTHVGEDLRWMGWVLGVALVAALLTRRSVPRRRELWAVVAVVAVGGLSLLTTRNQGVWFEVPLELLGITLVAAATSSLTVRPRRVAEVAAGAMAVAVLVAAAGDDGGDLGLGPGFSTAQQARSLLYGGLVEKERVLGKGDPRLLDPDADVRRDAAAEWWDTNVRLAELLRRKNDSVDGMLMVTLSGNSHLLNGQSLLLTQQLRSLPTPPTEVPDTAAPDADLAPFLEPRWRGTHERVLVLVRARSLPFPEDREVPRFRRLALAAGWEQTERLPLPDGGDVLILEHP